MAFNFHDTFFILLIAIMVLTDPGRVTQLGFISFLMFILLVVLNWNTVTTVDYIEPNVQSINSHSVSVDEKNDSRGALNAIDVTANNASDTENTDTEKEIADIDKENANINEEIADVEKEIVDIHKEITAMHKGGTDKDEEIIEIDNEIAEIDEEIVEICIINRPHNLHRYK